MRRVLLSVAVVLLTSGCSSSGDEAGSAPASPAPSPSATAPSLGEATPVNPPADDKALAGDRWAWIEDPDGIGMPLGVRVLRENADAFDLYNWQFIAEEFELACQRLDTMRIGSVIWGEGWDLYGEDYAGLVYTATTVACPEHSEAVLAWSEA